MMDSMKDFKDSRSGLNVNTRIVSGYGNTNNSNGESPLPGNKNLTVEELNEKEVLEHPDEVTEVAQLGVKKAEGIALVWNKKTLFATYAL